jgi:hypothetical protein
MYDDIGRVSADLVINGKELSPAQITELVGIEPDYSHDLGSPIFNNRGKRVGGRKSNYWRYGSANRVRSKELDEHVRMVLGVFEPRAAVLRKLAERNDVYIWTLWESFGLILGAGPIISPAACRVIAAIGAELHFDIFCLREHDLSGPPQGADGKAVPVEIPPKS